MRLNVAPLVLALASAAYAVPITNDNSAVTPPEATVVPRGTAMSQIGEIVYNNLRVASDPGLESFIQNVRAIQRVPTSSQANTDGPVRYQFFVHPPSSESHDPSVMHIARAAVHPILKQWAGTRGIIEEEGHLMSSLEMFGLQVNSAVSIGDPARGVTCPCDVWVRVKQVEGRRPITSIFTSHATKKQAAYMVDFEH
ncbi:uncharacterized protein C8R40DRAFT_1072925 [Lentinula edodes]|uniref:uncharacterized protein n=1 Tax=Lentinula edodes TaxID=5353 RepID=UPI001E8EA649|nr:uncharacterized protein C8R40DRAFT_1072925 [Lentinula edodes]KAH7870931.1 hypothetical protein C8R40DRAFT_1072925 [Lentinula edodes]